MIEIQVSEKDYNKSNLYYVKTGIAEITEKMGGKLENIDAGSRSLLKVSCDDYYGEILRVELLDMLSDIVAINYKYDFFKKNIFVNGLSKSEEEILMASLIAADLDDDKKYVFDKLKNLNDFALDGIYNFRLKPLKKKWLDIVSYMPSCFINSQLKDFISYLLENKRKRVYIDNGKVYDYHFKRLKKCDLLGGENLKVVREVLLSNCKEVEISGNIPEEDEFYLKQYYGDKIIFSESNYS